MKPIETEYNGFLFRSRLEARWAVFFDTLNVKYGYETEGFEVNGVRYLPDFYLPDYNCWIEIKPRIINEQESYKYTNFAKEINDKFIVIMGTPKENSYQIKLLSYKDDDDDDCLERCSQEKFVFALARRAKNNELCLLSDACAVSLINESTDDGKRWPETIGLEDAYKKATQARFEFKNRI